MSILRRSRYGIRIQIIFTGSESFGPPIWSFPPLPSVIDTGHCFQTRLVGGPAKRATVQRASFPVPTSKKCDIPRSPIDAVGKCVHCIWLIHHLVKRMMNYYLVLPARPEMSSISCFLGRQIYPCHSYEFYVPRQILFFSWTWLNVLLCGKNKQIL